MMSLYIQWQVDPDRELHVRGGSGSVLLALPVVLPSVIFSCFLPKIRGGRVQPAPPLDLPLIFNLLLPIIHKKVLYTES